MEPVVDGSNSFALDYLRAPSWGFNSAAAEATGIPTATGEDRSFVAGQIERARTELGDPTATVEVVPVVFEPQGGEAQDASIWRLDAQTGSRFIDDVGRIYKDFKDWKEHNELPPGTMTFPSNGRIDGSPETKNTPSVKDTFWEHAADAGDKVAFAGGLLLTGAAIVGTGGLALPIAGAALAAYGLGRTGERIKDMADHKEDMSLGNAEARTNYLSAGASALGIGAMGASMGAAKLATAGTLTAGAASATARIGVASQWADVLSMGDAGGALAKDWDRLTPSERSFYLLQIAISGAGMGVQANRSGGVKNLFDPSAQKNQLLQTTAEANRTPVTASRPGVGGDADVEYKQFPGEAFLKGNGDRFAVDPNDLAQGELGDCWLIAGMATKAGEPLYISSMVKSLGKGMYEVTIYERKRGQPKSSPKRVVVDDWFPTFDGKTPAYAQFGDKVDGKLELWPALVEKALAKVKGGYHKIDAGGSGADGVMAVTGHTSRWWNLKEHSADEIASTIGQWLDEGRGIIAASREQSQMSSSQRLLAKKLDLVFGHAYQVKDITDTTVDLFNPHGENHLKGLKIEDWKALFDDVDIEDVRKKSAES